MSSKPGKFFIPFNGYKGFEIENEVRTGNLSNMKTNAMINLSSDKSRSGLKKIVPNDMKSKGALLEAKFYKNKVQSKLKKLIGSEKTQIEISKKVKANLNVFYCYITPKKKKATGTQKSPDQPGTKEKKRASQPRKKTMKLNLSSDSMSKLCAQVESYIKTKFPVTAPNGKTKDKQLFLAYRKENKAGTPKYSSIEDISKKPLKGNLALIAALSGVQGKKKLTPTTGALLKNNQKMSKSGKFYTPSNSKISRNGESKSKISKGKSNKASKIGAKSLAKYSKANFFLKNNYMRSTPSSKLKARNLTGDQLKIETEQMLVDSYHPDKAKKKVVYISDEQAQNFEPDRILAVEEILHKINLVLEQEFEIYDLIKEYVDIVQELEFGELYLPIKQSKVKDIIKRALILERWAMFFIFFFYFNEEVLEEKGDEIKLLAKVIHHNSLLILEFWSDNLSKRKGVEKKYKLIKSILKDRELKSLSEYLGFEDFFPIVQNNNTIFEIFKRCKLDLSAEISEGIHQLELAIKKMSLKDGLEACLDTYCKFLIEKGVVSVEYSSDQQETEEKDGDTPLTDTTKNTTAVNKKGEHHLVVPYLPEPSMKYTLVLDLDETLVHYEDNGVTGQFYLRPYAQEFIDDMSKYYEIVIFTAALQDYADWILNRLDTNKSVTHRLYRQHTSADGNTHLKDLSKLGRNLSHTIIVDNIPENFQLQPENGIYIKSWFKDPDDSALMELMPLLKEIVLRNTPDVRRALQTFRDKMIQNIKRGCLQPHLNLTLD